MHRFLTLIALLLLSACGFEIYGRSAFYDQRAENEHIEVHMPPDAPYINQQFGPRTEDGDLGHYGIDIYAKLGAPVIAAASGVVTGSFYEPMYGNRVVIDHGRDPTGRRVETVYKHLKKRLVTPGTRASRGQQIGTMGATGALGLMVHLHFETRFSAPRGYLQAVDPHLTWLNGKGNVTCFDPDNPQPDSPFGMTYPVPCRGDRALPPPG